MLLAVYGLYAQAPLIHLGLAAIGILPFWFPAWHPFDRLYNHLLRPLWHGVVLPPNPLQRRIACLMGGLMNIGVAVSFQAGSVPAAYGFGIVLIILQLIVITTHFCVASWMYEGLMKMLGRWNPPIPLDQARQLLAEGALLVDVREPFEFEEEHLPNAINMPLEELERHLEDFQDRTAIFYCRSGMRCQQATQMLEKQCRGHYYNFGAMSRWMK